MRSLAALVLILSAIPAHAVRSCRNLNKIVVADLRSVEDLGAEIRFEQSSKSLTTEIHFDPRKATTESIQTLRFHIDRLQERMREALKQDCEKFTDSETPEGYFVTWKNFARHRAMVETGALGDFLRALDTVMAGRKRQEEEVRRFQLIRQELIGKPAMSPAPATPAQPASATSAIPGEVRKEDEKQVDQGSQMHFGEE